MTIFARCRFTLSRRPYTCRRKITNVAIPELREFQKRVPPGYRLTIGGEYDKQQVGFRNLGVVLAISVAGIFLALLFQFNNAIKRLLAFAAAPYGVAGALIALWIMKPSFGFMAFLGIANLIGVIVSHGIVLFHFLEEMHALGEPFERAVIDAGIIRLRPVMITLGATVLARFPLAVQFASLPDGTNYAQQTVLDAKAKQMKVTTSSSNYAKRAQ